MRRITSKTLIVLLTLLLVSFLTSAQGLWQQAGEAPVPGGTGQAIVATDEGVFMICQRCEITETRFFEFLPGTTSNIQLNTDDLPEAAFRDGSALVWDEDSDSYLYALLGSRSPAEGDSDRRFFYRYSLLRDRWESLQETPFPQGNGDALVYTEFGDHRLIYALLGSNVDRNEDLDRDDKSVLAIFDLGTLQWRSELVALADSWIEDGTASGASLVWDRFDRIYALQGDVEATRASARFASYTLASGIWQDLDEIPETSFQAEGCGVGPGASLAYLGHIDESQTNFIYALGGGCHDGSPGTNAYRYHIDQDFWEQITSIPCPVGLYNGNRFFIFRDELHYAQSGPETSEYICGGDDVFRFTLP